MSLCGYFLEIALPTPAPEAAKAYWERLGFVGIDEPDDRLPHVSCTSDTIDLGLYDPAHLRGSALRFEVDDSKETLARLADIGIVPAEAAAPRRSQSAGTVLNAPEGTQLLLTEAPEA
jgi:hypothetical protein